MYQREKSGSWNFLFFIVISFYSIGAGFVESLVNYPLWHIIGPSDVWINYHQALGPRIIFTLAIPALLLQLISNILLIIHRPAIIPKWTVWLTFFLLMVAVISSVVIQIPIQGKLDNGYSKEMVDQLISSDLLMRTSIAILRGFIIVYMMSLYMVKMNHINKS